MEVNIPIGKQMDINVPDYKLYKTKYSYKIAEQNLHTVFARRMFLIFLVLYQKFIIFQTSNGVRQRHELYQLTVMFNAHTSAGQKDTLF